MGFAPPHHSHQAPYIPPAGHVTQPYPPHSAGVGIPHPVHHNPIHHAGSPYPHSNTVYPPTHASVNKKIFFIGFGSLLYFVLYRFVPSLAFCSIAA